MDLQSTRTGGRGYICEPRQVGTGGGGWYLFRGIAVASIPLTFDTRAEHVSGFHRPGRHRVHPSAKRGEDVR